MRSHRQHTLPVVYWLRFEVHGAANNPRPGAQFPFSRDCEGLAALRRPGLRSASHNFLEARFWTTF